MALNDDAVVVAAQGFVYVNDVGATAPTPDELDDLDPETFGSQTNTVTVTGTPTGGTFTLTIAGSASGAIAYNASPDVVQSAVEAVSTVGAGNTVVSGTSLASGIAVTFVGPLQGQTVAVTASATGLTGGTTPAVTAAVSSAANGWDQIGHTSRGKMPEFGFDGGKLEMKGTWQKERLREIRTGDPVADSLKITLEQWDADSLELYFGANVSDVDGVFAVDGNFNPVYKSFLVFIVDGPAKIGFYASKAEVQRDASVDLPIDDFAGLPIEATFLNLGTRPLYSWISNALFPSSS